MAPIFSYVGDLRYTVRSIDIEKNVSACDKWSRAMMTDHSLFVLRLLEISNGLWCSCPSSAAEAAYFWCLECFRGRDVGGATHTYQDHLSRTCSLPSWKGRLSDSAFPKLLARHDDPMAV